MSADWVTVETFWSVEEAQLARGFLEGEGIPCQLEGLATAGNFWHLSNATGGVKLLVTGGDAERAAELLRNVAHHDDLDDESSVAFAEESETPTGIADEDDDRDDIESDAAQHHGLFDKLRSGKWLVILLVFMPTLIGITIGVLMILLRLLSLLTGQ